MGIMKILNYQTIIFPSPGGKIHYIDTSIFHLMRGQTFCFNGVRIFTMGGATSTDKQYRREGVSWWKEEMPNYQEYEEAYKNLEKCNWNVDHVISHTGPAQLIKESKIINEDKNQLEDFFDIIDNRLMFKHWYFGHFHQDRRIDEKHSIVYNNLIKLR
jgi:hypothetical protein